MMDIYVYIYIMNYVNDVLYSIHSCHFSLSRVYIIALI